MKFIVSANYRDRHSEFKWLIRTEEQAPSEAIAFKRVEASGVEFITSGEYERGFGCAIVARCDFARGYEQEAPKGERITFHWNEFQDNDGNRVKRVAKLDLTPDGGMYAHGINTPRPAVLEHDPA